MTASYKPCLRRIDALLDIVSALARPKLDDAEICQVVRHERIFPDDRLNLLPGLTHGQDDTAIARNLATGHQEIPRSVMHLQEPDVRAHVRVDLVKARLIDEFDDEHRAPSCTQLGFPRASTDRLAQ